MMKYYADRFKQQKINQIKVKIEKLINSRKELTDCEKHENKTFVEKKKVRMIYSRI